MPRTRQPLPVVLAITLPLLLAVAVAVIGLTGRISGVDAPPPPDTTPLATPPVEAPDAGSPECTALLARLDGGLPADGSTLPVRELAEPAPAGVRAWAASPRPVVLRCGLPRPAELTPTSALLEIDGVQWLELDDGVPDPVVVTYVTVDRPVYVVLTTPVDAGSGPLQTVSGVVRDTLPATAVAVR
ncbi:DUF3515 domain-containing protein [Pseudonocardia sp.]|uniref:DUF3515 domain-containing protein n=1 Tax=Pseudonocardia sp. TaxID=60912 RepID=UPI0026160274|nr:DUF3515 domain-containing protein [Pseudonocardia sp.]